MATKKQMILLAVLLLILSIGFTVSYLKLNSDSQRKITFEECEKAGGTAWQADPPKMSALVASNHARSRAST